MKMMGLWGNMPALLLWITPEVDVLVYYIYIYKDYGVDVCVSDEMINIIFLLCWERKQGTNWC